MHVNYSKVIYENFLLTSFNSDATIYCYKGSTAEICAEEYGMKIAYLDGYDPETERKITFNHDEIVLLSGETRQIGIAVLPDYDNPAITWSSEDASIVSVENGSITGVKKGSCTITGTLSNGNNASCKVTVLGSNLLKLPAKMERIESFAFSNLPMVDGIIVPDSVTFIADSAFDGNKGVLIVQKNSYAHTWAVEHNADYIVRE